VVLLLSALSCFSLYAALHPGTGPGRGLNVLLGLFIAFMGNYLATVRPNYFVGIRTPWTLESPVVWEQTHRLAGRLFFGAGLLVTLGALVAPPAWGTALLLVLVLGAAAVSYAYSYFCYRRLASASN
jgi:uncharacterized membrane protein